MNTANAIGSLVATLAIIGFGHALIADADVIRFVCAGCIGMGLSLMTWK
mgnify:CR=1 FL=1